jgi:hypothetical protein
MHSLIVVDLIRERRRAEIAVCGVDCGKTNGRWKVGHIGEK